MTTTLAQTPEAIADRIAAVTVDKMRAEFGRIAVAAGCEGDAAHALLELTLAACRATLVGPLTQIAAGFITTAQALAVLERRAAPADPATRPAGAAEGSAAEGSPV